MFQAVPHARDGSARSFLESTHARAHARTPARTPAHMHVKSNARFPRFRTTLKDFTEARSKCTNLLLAPPWPLLASLALPKPGEGPSEALMESGFFEATVFAVGSLGASVVRKMRSKGDPGNVSTVKMLLACVRVMRQRNFELQGGLFTPATAFGADLLPALRESGVSWG